MIEKHDIIKMARHVFRRSAGRRDRHLMHPHREWFIGIGVAVLVLTLGTVLAVVRYQTYTSLDPVGGEAGVTVVTYREALVTDALARFAERRAHYEALTSAAPLAPAAAPEPAAASSTATSTAAASEVLPATDEVGTPDATSTEPALVPASSASSSTSSAPSAE